MLDATLRSMCAPVASDTPTLILSATTRGCPVGWRVQSAGPNRLRLTDRAKKWRAQVVAMLKLQWGARAPLEERVGIEVIAIFPRAATMDCDHSSRPRRCACTPAMIDGSMPLAHLGTPDLTNVLKLAEDALKIAGIIVDDRVVGRQINDKRFARRGESPGVTIRLTLEPLR